MMHVITVLDNMNMKKTNGIICAVGVIFSVIVIVLASMSQRYYLEQSYGFSVEGWFYFFAFILGLYQINNGNAQRCSKGVSLILAVVGIIIGFIASIVDPLLTNIFSQKALCMNKDGNQFWSHLETVTTQGVTLLNSTVCNSNSDPQSHDCNCMFGNDHSTCWQFDGHHDCSLIWNKFLPIYKSAAAWEVITEMWGMVFLVIMCISCCYHNELRNSVPIEPAPVTTTAHYTTEDIELQKVIIATATPVIGDE